MTASRCAPLLLIEADPAQVETVAGWLRRAGYDVTSVSSAAEALAVVRETRVDVVLLDMDMPGRSGLTLLQALRALPQPPAVIALTASAGSVSAAVEAMRAGACDFLVKPVAQERVLAAVGQTLAAADTTSVETVPVRRPVAGSKQQAGFHGFIGSSLPMQAVYRMIERAAASKATVFVTGESGVGKEVCAQSVHQLSPRASGPFVGLNCAAIPKDLIESEVFGHVKGAFTGATADRDGAARQADGGTLFLDEICEMDLSLQGKLLRFLQTGTFQRVGGSKPETVDVRIVCATNRDPLMEVEAGRFREDLYYRLHVIPLALPPLRDRENDVLEIARLLLQTYTREEGRKFKGFSPEVEQILLNYDWPGNVRQLQNIIRNVVVMHDGEAVTPDMIPPPVGGRWARPHGFRRPGGALPLAASAALPAIRPLAEVEREAIENAIALCDGNVPKAAALLGVSPSTLYRKKQVWDGG